MKLDISLQNFSYEIYHSKVIVIKYITLDSSLVKVNYPFTK